MRRKIGHTNIESIITKVHQYLWISLGTLGEPFELLKLVYIKRLSQSERSISVVITNGGYIAQEQRTDNDCSGLSLLVLRKVSMMSYKTLSNAKM